MELIYNVSVAGNESAQNGKPTPLNGKNQCVCCCLSSKNLLSFSVFTNCEHESSTSQKQCRVYVCDLDKPWNAYEVTRYNNEVVAIQWDANSEKLLIADVTGSCQLWTMQDHMMNKWNKVGKLKLKGERILVMSWFTSGIACYLNVDKKDSSLYTDRFCTVVNTPTLSHFGGLAMQGFMVVTATALVSAGIFDPMDGSLQTTDSSLAPTHLRFSLADVCHTKDGQIMVATSDGHVTSLIRCFLVSIQSQRSFVIESKSASSFYIKGDKNSNAPSKISHLKFAGAGNTDTLLIGTSSPNSSCIEIWHLLEQNIFLHSSFQNASPSHSKSSFQTIKWMHKASITQPSVLSSIAPSRLHLIRVGSDFTAGSGTVTSYVSAVYNDGAVKLIQPQLGQVITATQIDDDVCQGTWLNSLTVTTQTVSGCGLVVLNPSGISLYRLINERDQPMYVSPSQLVMLMEYCLITGYDSWDVMLALKQGMCEGILQKLTDTFHKQPVTVQDRMYIRFLETKLCIHLLAGSGRLKVTELHAKLVLSGVSVAIQQTLQPKVVSSNSSSPCENLLSNLIKSMETDVDKVILTLDSHDFLVEPGILLSLQHLIQWITNFTLLLLVSLPHSAQADQPGTALLKDVTLLQTLREQLVIVRIWSMLHRPCEPKYLTSGGADCLSVMFSLLTRIWLTVKEGMEWEDSLIDECAMLPTKIFTPSLESTYMTPSRTNYLYSKPLPLDLKLNRVPDFVSKSRVFLSNSILLDIGGDVNQHRDVIHQTALGVSLSSGVKQCVRCGCITACLVTSPKAKVLSAAMKAWEQRWTKNCFCLGMWKYLPPK